MTELVRPLDHDRLGRSLCAGLVSLTVALALPVTVTAAPARGATSEGPVAPTSDVPELPEPAAIRSALEAGDLSTARELAVARSEAQPSADNFVLEAEVQLALGDYERAKLALDRALELLPEDAADDRAMLTSLRDEVEARSRGARPDEPESTHREQLDRERSERPAVPHPTLPAEPIDEPTPREPIVKKWYFWVTLGAIVATAGAIVGVAVASSLDERKATAGSPQGLQAGGMTIRF
jgi:hypothetical protein